MSPLAEAVARIAKFCPSRRLFHWQLTPKGPYRIAAPLQKQHLEEHVAGTMPVGLSPIAPGTSTTRIALLDFDSHKGEVDWPSLTAVAARVDRELAARELYADAYRSRGGKGIHLYLYWGEPQDAYSVRALLTDILHQCGLANGTKGVARGQVEIFPKQDSVPEDGYGNMFILPLAGASVPLDKDMRTLPREQSPEILPLSEPVPAYEKPTEPVFTEHEHPESLNTLAGALNALPNDDLDYDAWRDVIFGIHHATGGSEEGLALARQWSAKSGKHDDAFLTERVWPYAKSERGGPVKTVQHIFNKAHATGWNDDIVNQFPMLDTASLDARAVEPRIVNPSIAGATPVGGPTKHTRFTGCTVAEHIERTGAVEWVIDGVIPRAPLTFLAGPPKSGKSFLALDMAGAVARGITWRGRATAHGKVAYVAAEGATGLAQRLRAYCEHHNVLPEDLNITMYPHRPKLQDGADSVALATQLQADGPFAMVIIDTLAASTAGVNENSGEDIGVVLGHCEGIWRSTRAPIVLVHHIGKDETKGLRGHSSMLAAADADIRVTRVDSLRMAKVENLKDGEDGAIFQFGLATVEVGKRTDGKPITSCVIQHRDDGSAGMQHVSRAEPSSTLQRTVFRTARDMLALCEGAEVMAGDVIRAAAERMFKDPEAKRDKRREYASRAMSGLVDGGWLRVTNGVVSVVERV